jgi:plastocyanin
MGRLLRASLIGVAAVALAACSSSGAPTSGVGGGASEPASRPTAAAPSQAAPSAVAAACGKTADTAGAVAVEIKDFSFNPGSITAKVGQPIAFTNADGVPHGAALDDGSCTTGTFGRGGGSGLVFSQPGTYPFHCPVHHDMTGTIEITS